MAEPRRARRALKDLIIRVHSENFGIYGVRKVGREINRRGQGVARCTVERLMRELGLQGAVRGKKIRTTIPDPAAERAVDPVKRNFVAAAPNRCWVAEVAHVPAYAGTVYVAFAVDTFSRRIVSWSAATSKATPLVLGALRMSLWQRDRAGQVRAGLIHHSDAGSQDTSVRLAAHLAGENIAASIGIIGDALDNALTESTIGLHKTYLIKRRGPWRTPTDVELGTAEWIDWYNNRRLHGEMGHVPPVEYEAEFYLSRPNLQLEAQSWSLARSRCGSIANAVHTWA